MFSEASRIRVLAVLGLFGAAYFLSLFFRSVNAILAPTLAKDLGVDAESLGLLTAAYFLGLGLCQVPIGIMLDAHGPRRVQVVLLSLAAAGSALMAIADGVIALTFSRALIGVGLAGCLMAAYHMAVLVLPQTRIPLANGLYLAAGGCGALAATGPVELAIQIIDWRTLFAIIAVFTFVLSLAIGYFAPDHPTPDRQNLLNRFKDIRVVARAPAFRKALPLTALCFGTGTAFQGLWVSSWLSDVSGVGMDTISLTLTAMAVSMTIGSAVGGGLSVYLEKRGLSLEHVILGSAVLFILSEIGLLLSPGAHSLALWLLFALTYNPVTLSYALVARSIPVEFVGRSNTCMNTIVILTTFIIQYGFGVMLSQGVSGHPIAGDPLLYRVGLSGLVGLQIIALAWWFLIGRLKTSSPHFS